MFKRNVIKSKAMMGVGFKSEGTSTASLDQCLGRVKRTAADLVNTLGSASLARRRSLTVVHWRVLAFYRSLHRPHLQDLPVYFFVCVSFGEQRLVQSQVGAYLQHARAKGAAGRGVAASLGAFFAHAQV